MSAVTDPPDFVVSGSNKLAGQLRSRNDDSFCLELTVSASQSLSGEGLPFFPLRIDHGLII